MTIKKQEFYEGAALYQLIRGSTMTNVAHSPPLFIFEDRLQVHLKYSTGKRTPWGFTFTPDEQVLLSQRANRMPLVIGLVCGADGIVALPYGDYVGIAPVSSAALRVACHRLHRERFEVRGPCGPLLGKIAPSEWARLLRKGETRS